MNIKVITAGNCMLCGKEIKIVTRRCSNNLPNIFFCPECEKQIQAKSVMKVSEVEVHNADSD